MGPRIWRQMTARASVAIAALTSVVGLTGQTPQGPVATFRTETSLVEVDVRVVDERGQFIRGLTAEDFELSEDGQRQPIASLDIVEMASASERSTNRVDTSTDVSSNAPLSAPGRYFLLVLDDLHGSTFRSETVKAIARRFVETTLRENDRIALVSTSGRTGPSHDFTTNRRSVVNAINRFSGQYGPGTTSLTGDPLPSTAGAPASPTPFGMARQETPEEEEDGRIGVQVAKGLNRWVTELAGASGQAKAIVLISEGIRYDTFQVMSRYARAIEDELKEAIASATRNNVTVYTIDPRGLPGQKAEITPIIGPDDEFFSDTSMRMKMSMRYLAGGTGGFALTNNSDFSGAFRRIDDETSHYYVLRYAPTDSGPGIRQLKVAVRRAGARVRSRRHVAFEPVRPEGQTDTESRLARVISHILPQPGLSMTVSTTSWRRHDRRTGVLVTIAADASAIWPATPALPRSATFRLVALEKSGKVKASRRITLPALHSQMTDFRIVSELDLPPGEYQLRIGGAADDGPDGSVHHDLSVPNFDAKPASISEPLLTARSVIGQSTVFTDIPAPHPSAIPTATRTFHVDDELFVTGRVFWNERRAPGSATVVVSVVNTAGKACSRAQATLTRSSEKETAYDLTVPLSECLAGPHALVVNVPPLDAGRATPLPGIPLTLVAAAGRPQDGPIAPAFPTEDVAPLDNTVTLSDLLTRASGYVQQFIREFGNAVAEERYIQQVTGRSARENEALRRTLGHAAPIRRELVSDLLLVRLTPSAWTPFRDVFEVDGQPVRDRQERLSALLLRPTVATLDQARGIVQESTRYNIGEVVRAINTPVFALGVFEGAIQDRFRFTLEREDTGMGAWVIRFTERADLRDRTPRSLVQSPDGRPLFSQGRAWVEVSGRIAKTEVTIRDGDLEATVKTTFRPDSRFAIHVPVEMVEDYSQPTSEITRAGKGLKRVTGRATYDRFRSFAVTTTESSPTPPPSTTKEVLR